MVVDLVEGLPVLGVPELAAHRSSSLEPDSLPVVFLPAGRWGMEAMEVELAYFEDCPNWQVAAARRVAGLRAVGMPRHRWPAGTRATRTTPDGSGLARHR
jgi:hypothetical protein